MENGRWATQRGRHALFGHHAGAKRVREIRRGCPDFGVEYLDDFGFSPRLEAEHKSRLAGPHGLVFAATLQRNQGLGQGRGGVLYRGPCASGRQAGQADERARRRKHGENTLTPS